MYDTQQGNNVDTVEQMIEVPYYVRDCIFEVGTNGKWHNNLPEEEKNRIARELTVFRLHSHYLYNLRISNEERLIEDSPIMPYDTYLYTQEAVSYLPSPYEEGVLLKNVRIEDNQIICNFYIQLIDNLTFDWTDPCEVRIIINIIN